MATKKDLVEAHAFSRRRLVTAFVSGAPGGREVEPARPGRSVVGGIALAVLLLAGAAILGFFKDAKEVDWDATGLVRDDRGALYVILDEDIPGFDEPRLRQVVNVTSAQLILGADQEVSEASAEEIAERPKGPPIGIVDAPSSVPASADLVNTGWTACTAAESGIRTAVGPEPDVSVAEGTRFLVQVGREQFLIADAPASAENPQPSAYAYRLPGGAGRDQIYSTLDLGSAEQAVQVSERWLSLFPAGADLDAAGLQIGGFGARISPDLADEGFPAGSRNGDYFFTGDQAVVLTQGGPAAVSPFALAVLQATPMPRQGGQPARLPAEVSTSTTGYSLTGSAAEGTQWPEAVPTGAQPQAFEPVCAVLQSEPGAPPAVTLGTDPGSDAAPDEVESGLDAEVVPGHGALVRAGDWSSVDTGTPFLVDDRAISYELAGDLEIANLGYGSVAEVSVPDTWLKLFDTGVELSQDAALCPPAAESGRACS